MHVDPVSPAGSWLADRRPAPPPALARRIEMALAAWAASEGVVAAKPTPEHCVAAAERLLQGLLGGGVGHGSRESAVDLLAADALVTYACELAADDPERLEAWAEAAMSRLAAFATPSARAPGR